MNAGKHTGRIVAELRKTIGKSQTQFAAMIGVSKHTIISVENGRNQLSGKLARQIRIATGADVLADRQRQIAALSGGKFSKDSFEDWRTRFSSEERNAQARFDEIKFWIALVLKAAAKPGVAGIRDRLPAVYLSLIDWLSDTRKTFKLEQEIDDILEDEAHEIVEISFGYEDLATDAQMARTAARLLDMTPKDLLRKFKQHTRGLKRGDTVILHVRAELRRAWNPLNDGAIGGFDLPKVRKILPKAEFQFRKLSP
jgi:DNA-binding XRE family transcriptional regulator